MSADASDLLRSLDRGAGASEEVVQSAIASLPVELPGDYFDFMRRSNGAEGSLAGTYLQLWPLETLVRRNALYAVDEFAPGLVLIGSDGGGTAYALMRTPEGVVFVEVPFIGMALDAVRVRGDSFAEFVEGIGRSEAQ